MSYQFWSSKQTQLQVNQWGLIINIGIRINTGKSGIINKWKTNKTKPNNQAKKI